MHEIVERLLVLAAPKKKAKQKYTKDVENSYDDLLAHFLDKSDYTKRDRAFRLMMRLKKALESEGYAFREKVMSVSPTTQPKAVGTPSKSKHLTSSGGLCTLLKSRPPGGLDPHATTRLMEYLRSKQCYQFTVSPSNPDAARKNGVNISLPKPLTWAKLENFGLVREPIFMKNGDFLMDEFSLDGICVYTIDRKTFYVSNAGMYRRWMSGLERIAEQAINR